MPFLHDHSKEKTKHFNSNKYVKIRPKMGYVPILTPKGWLYEGEWFDDKRQGFGVLAKRRKNKTFAPKYRGDWKTDKRHGSGNGYYIDGGYYVGQWKVNQRHGYGRMWYADGSFYDGDWEKDFREGLGLFVQVNGDRYEGEWSGDTRHGLGRLFHLGTGQMQEGVWVCDEAICTSMEDIPWRQTAPFATEYPIQKVMVKNPDAILGKFTKKDKALSFVIPELIPHIRESFRNRYKYI